MMAAPRAARQTMYTRWGKRALDVTLCVLTLPLWLPILAALAAALRVAQGPPVFFRQQRPGLGGRPFTLVKLRTMNDARDPAGRLLPDEARLTAIGRAVRAASLDELPELWAVLRGDMSLVGPRPLLMHYLPLYSPRQARRHEVRPGITGLAQVQGRNAQSWEERFEHDVFYVDHVSLGLDLKILALTVWKTLTLQGISHPGHATMLEFAGSGTDTGRPLEQ